jgi:hypothetical protein
MATFARPQTRPSPHEPGLSYRFEASFLGGRSVRGQNRVFLLLVSELIMVPVGFAFYSIIKFFLLDFLFNL